MRVLVTGGAGFIGSHIVDALVAEGHEVAVLDSLVADIYGGSKPSYLNPRAQYVWKDIRDREALEEVVRDVGVVFHMASLIDIEESMRELGKYVDSNVVGTAVLLDTLQRYGRSLERLVLPSSAAVYGEGTYRCSSCGDVEPGPREGEQLRSGRWEVLCPTCGHVAKPQPTAEDKTPSPISIYGLTKLVQERLCGAFSVSLGTPVVVLRYANVYGTRQRAGRYAGVCTTFLSRALEGEPPVVHEDGLQSRDFVSVEDVVRANLLAMHAEVKGSLVVNIGTGRPTSVLQIWELISRETGAKLQPLMDGTFRPGDVRHLWLDPRRARQALGFKPSVRVEDGLKATITASL